MRARVYRRNGGKWFVDYTDHAGRRVRRWAPEAKTKADAQEALRRALSREADIRDGRVDLVDNSAEVGGLLEAFLLHKLASRRYATMQFYRVCFADMLGTFHMPDGRVWPPDRETPADTVRAQERTFTPAPHGLKAARIEDITPERVEVYIEERRATRATRTLNKAVVALKTLLDWAVKAGLIRSNPVRVLSRAGKPGRRQRALDTGEVHKLLDASPEPYQTMWLGFLTTGLRRGELTKLRWPQVDFGTDTIRVLPDTSKSKRQRDVPIVPELRERLLMLRQRSSDLEGFVFVNRDGGPWLNNLSRRFARCVERAGLDDPASVTIHTLRHTFATQLLLAGVNPKVVSDLLGHASIAITLDIYGHVFPRNKQEAVAALPFGDGRSKQKGHPWGTGSDAASQLRKAQ